MAKDDKRAAYGDFQTPVELARKVVRRLAPSLTPSTIVEPNCGEGSFMVAAREVFSDATIVGLDINRDHVAAARRACPSAQVEVADFFATNWEVRAAKWREPILVLGNPPWVTTADLCVLGFANAPTKTNFKGYRGLAAKTGKSNFDISESMLIRLLEALQGRKATVAMLVKTAVARRVLEYAWVRELRVGAPALVRIDAKAGFGAAVDACVLRFETASRAATVGEVYESPEADQRQSAFGLRSGMLVADLDAYDACASRLGEADPSWRSGLKHDCAKVMELRPDGDRLVNGLGEEVHLESSMLFPLLKAGDLRDAQGATPSRAVIVPQRRLGENTEVLAEKAPATWAYLNRHADRLDARRSSIYRGQPRFCVFGIGPYTFAPWKICVAGLHKRIAFALLGPRDGKPVVPDDTCYFLPFEDEPAARAALVVLRSEPAAQVIRAFAFWDAKRPITKEILSRLDLSRLGRATTPS